MARNTYTLKIEMNIENQDEINNNLVSRGISVNFIASRTRTHSTQNSGVTRLRYTANVTKDDFNRDVNVDVRSIAGESDQARNYEIPEAIDPVQKVI